MPDKNNPGSPPSLYESLGASASKNGLHRALEAAGAPAQSDYFCSLEDDIAGSPEYASFLHCDGCGTKGIAAYLLFRETGDPAVFAGLAQDAFVMNLDDVFCLGSPDGLMLANIISRNARLIPDEAISAIISGYRNFAGMLRGFGIGVALSGGETADCGDIVRTISVDAVLSGRIKRASLMNLGRIVPGDLILGLQSDGQTSYESRPNSGIGSNGLTLARHALLSARYAEKYPETSQASPLPGRGFLLTEMPEDLDTGIGQALCSPTRTYAPILREIYEKFGPAIHGAVHVTGGGLTKVIRFGRGNHYIKDSLFPAPPVFRLIQKTAAVPWKEMYQVFNMGQRMEIYAPETCATGIISTTASFGIKAQVIGRVEKAGSEANLVTVRSEHGSFTYQA